MTLSKPHTPKPDHTHDPDHGLWGSMNEGVEARRARLRPMWEMTPAQRVAAMYRGELTLEQALAWAARHPDQVPAVNGDSIMRGEFAFIAATTPEACIACPVCHGEVFDCGDGPLIEHPDERDPSFGIPHGFCDGLVPACPASGLTLTKAREAVVAPKAVT
jgi:hypothetical protein